MPSKTDISKDLIALICATDAFCLRKSITNKLWECIESKIDINNPLKELWWLSPEGFHESLHMMLEEDAQTLRICWRALNHSQQQLETKWCSGLGADENDSNLNDKVEDAVSLLIRDRHLSAITNNVIRLSSLVESITQFWQACRAYFEGEERTPSQKELLLKYFAELFAVLVMPVTKNNGNYHLYTLCPNPKYKGIHRLHATTDMAAYEKFYSYASGQMLDIVCSDYREDMQSGIRSLNCIYFNHLKMLSTCGDHPAALLFGCRSGAQFQILANSSSQHNIVGMVAVYFPLYGLWDKIFSLSNSGPLMGKANFNDADEEYRKFWDTEDYVGDIRNAGINLATKLLAPVRQDADCKEVVSHLSFLSKYWDKIQLFPKQNPLPSSVSNALNLLENSEFNPETTRPVIDWFEALCDSYNKKESAIVPQQGSKALQKNALHLNGGNMQIPDTNQINIGRMNGLIESISSANKLLTDLDNDLIVESGTLERARIKKDQKEIKAHIIDMLSELEDMKLTINDFTGITINEPDAGQFVIKDFIENIDTVADTSFNADLDQLKVVLAELSSKVDRIDVSITNKISNFNNCMESQVTIKDKLIITLPIIPFLLRLEGELTLESRTVIGKFWKKVCDKVKNIGQ